MKSRITIEVDFENDNISVIQVLRANSTEDTRDSLIHNFFERQREVFRWCRLEYRGETLGGGSRYFIIPLTAKELPHELNLMNAMIKTSKEK